ncbi:MAG: alpha-E domain-containing protein [Nitriliruptoraceae bacterium]
MSMLARLAENLFWAGRYVERAEDTARMVDVTYHTLLESPPHEMESSWFELLDVLHLAGAYAGKPLSGEAVMEFLVLDRDTRGSIAASVARARENVRSVRELVSSELWAAVNDLHLMMAARDLRQDLADQPFELFAAIRSSCMTIYGAASETMPRDDGWRFMALGRLLERAEMTCRLISVRYAQLEALGGPSLRFQRDPAEPAQVQGADRTDFHQWVAVLKSASALEAYRRRYRSSMDPGDVVEFLLLEPDLPRSVMFSLTSAMTLLEQVGRGRSSRSVRALGRTVAAVKYRDVTELFEEGLIDFLETVQRDVALVAELIADEFFRHRPDGELRAISRI